MQKIMALDSISTVIHVSQFFLNCFEIVSHKFSFYNILLILPHTNFAEKLLTLDCGLNVFKKMLFFSFSGKVIPNEKVHPRLWKGSDRKFRYINWKNAEKKKQNKVITDSP